MVNGNKLIGLLGESKSGKDYILPFLDIPQDKLLKIKFADILKSKAEELYPLYFNTKVWESSGDSYREFYVEDISMTRREILTSLGPKLLEEDPEYKLRYISDVLDRESNKIIIITDSRFIEECEIVKKVGGCNIKIYRELKYRYPKEWISYCDFLDERRSANSLGFISYCKTIYPKLHSKLTHFSEKESSQVLEELLDHKFTNSPHSLIWNEELEKLNKYIASYVRSI
jgi:hypothetical protein